MSRGMPAVLSAILVALLAAAMVAGFLVLSGRWYLVQQLTGGPQPAPTPVGTVQAAPAAAYWGAFLPGADTDTAVVSRFASATGRQPAIVSMYQQWSGEPAFPSATARWLADRGAVPLVVWEPWRPGLTGGAKLNQPAYRLSAIAAGNFDAYVRRYADQVRAYAGPLLLEPLHEMNGSWYPWSGTVNGNTTADYVAAWQHLHAVFQVEGATNVTWTWTPNGETVPNTAANQPERYWPGARYVDWVGLDSYNWGTTTSIGWRTVAKMFDANVAALRSYGKPIVFAETASVEQGGDKAAWIASLFETLAGSYQDVVAAVVWFDDGGWRTNTSPAAQSAFAAGVSRPGILSAGHVVVGAAGPA